MRVLTSRPINRPKSRQRDFGYAVIRLERLHVFDQGALVLVTQVGSIARAAVASVAVTGLCNDEDKLFSPADLFDISANAEALLIDHAVAAVEECASAVA